MFYAIWRGMHFLRTGRSWVPAERIEHAMLWLLYSQQGDISFSTLAQRTRFYLDHPIDERRAQRAVNRLMRRGSVQSTRPIAPGWEEYYALTDLGRDEARYIHGIPARWRNILWIPRPYMPPKDPGPFLGDTRGWR